MGDPIDRRDPYIAALCRHAGEASYLLATLGTAAKNKALEGMAERLKAETEAILRANAGGGGLRRSPLPGTLKFPL